MVEDSRHDSARSAGRRRHDDSAGSVLLTDGKGIGIDQSTGLKSLLVAGSLDVIRRSLPRKVERSRKDTLMVYAPFHGRFHGLPDLLQIIPDVRPFAKVNIFPIAASFVLAPFLDLRKAVHLIDIRSQEPVVRPALGQRSAADTVHRPLIRLVAFGVKRLEAHPVGMIRKEHLRLPHNAHRGDAFQHFDDGHVRHVPLSRGGETTVERDLEGGRLRMPSGKVLGRLVRPHRVAARRPLAYSV